MYYVRVYIYIYIYIYMHIDKGEVGGSQGRGFEHRQHEGLNM